MASAPIIKDWANISGLPAFALPLINRLKVVPLSKRRLPPVRLSVEPPDAEALPDCVICSPRSVPPRFPVVFAVALVVVPTVLPTAVVAPPATLPTVDVVVFTPPPTVLPTPPSNPPPPLRCPLPAVVLERDDADELVMVCDPSRSSLADDCAPACA